MIIISNISNEWCVYLRWELDLRMMFSKNVFWGATRPRRPPGIMGAPLLPRSRLLAMFAQVCRFGHIGGENKTRARWRGWLRQRRWPRYRFVLYFYNFCVAVSSENIFITSIVYYNIISTKSRIENTTTWAVQKTNGVDEGWEAWWRVIVITQKYYVCFVQLPVM